MLCVPLHRSMADEIHFLPAYRRERFYRRDSEEICGSSGGKKKGNQEEIENKIKAVHRRLTRTYPVYYDWWLQDGKTGDVDWFSKSFNQELSVRLQKLNINTSVTNTPESIETAFQSYLKACEQRRIKRLTALHCR